MDFLYLNSSDSLMPTRKENMLRTIGIDIETTGLNPRHDAILEIAVIAVDENREIIGTYQSLIKPKSLLSTPFQKSRCNEFVQQMHADTGLWDELEASPLIEYVQVEQEIITMLDQCGWTEPVPLLGSSPRSLDYPMLVNCLPAVAKRLSHRTIDNSAFCEILGSFHGYTHDEVGDVLEPAKEKASSLCPGAKHRALWDIYVSLFSLEDLEAELAHPIIDIHSGAGVSGELSNFAIHPFTFDGVRLESMENLLQSLKFSDPEQAEKVQGMTPKIAKKTGGSDWQADQTLYWKGEPMLRDSQEYQDFLTEAFDALFTNGQFRMALESSKGHWLVHRIGEDDPTKTVLTSGEFLGHLERLQKSL